MPSRRLTPHGLAFLAFLAFYLLVIIDVRHKAWRDPGSYFFDPEHAFERQYSLEREIQAEGFIDTAIESPSPAQHAKAASDASFCVGITTVQRDGARYFRRAMGSVLEGLTETERKDIFMVPFIVNVDPTEHVAYKEPWLEFLSDQVLTYSNATETTRAKLQEITAPGLDSRRKALFDYVYLLRHCYAMDRDWIVILEDDTIAAEGWFYRTKNAVQELVGTRDFHKTVYLRLFYNERIRGWNNEEWITYAVRVVLLEIFILVVLSAATRLPPAAGILTPRTVVTITFLLAPMCITLYFAAGRLTVAGPPRGISRMNSYGCCSQAFVFPREQIPQLVDWYEQNGNGYIDPLTHRDKTQVDSLTEIYANKHGLMRYALTPSVFQHVGGQSTKPTSITRWGRSNAENIWNFSFEALDRRKLKKEHFG